MQQATLHSGLTEHTYYAKWPRRYRGILFIYPFLSLFNLITGIRTHSRWNLILAMFFLVLVPFIIRSWRSIRLVITPDGIAYRSGGAVLNVPWQDMEYIGPISQRGYRGWEGIILQNSNWKAPRWFPGPNRWRPQFIPLWSRWNGPWWDREIFDNIFFYAPWLADNAAEHVGEQRTLV